MGWFSSNRRPFRRILPQSLFGRSLLIIVVPVLLIQLISTYVFFDRHWSKMTERLSHGVAGEVALLVDQFYILQNRDDGLVELARWGNKMDLTVSFIAGEAFEKIKDEWQRGVQKELGTALAERIQESFNVSPHIRREWIEIDIEIVQQGVLHIQIPERRLFSSTAYVFLLWMIGSAALLSFIAILFMRNQIRPIRQLARAADRFGRGLDVPKFRESGAREVRQAAAAFEKMRERIARQIEQRTTMLAGVSHDLRTPLTRIKLELELSDNAELAEAIKKDIRDMERMIDGYLEFARGEDNESARMIDFSDFMRAMVESVVKQGVKINAKIDDDLQISLKATSFRRCIDNILSNAQKYANHIWLRVHRLNEKTIEITVDDDGVGIPEDNLEDVFKPFFRMDESRNIETGGVGLGLSITRDIIHAHGGKIWLEKSDKGGVRAVIQMPLARED